MLETNLGYDFRDRMILNNALTHKSYLRKSEFLGNNERLEFLGDSVLGFIVTFKLYNEYNMTEGELSKFRQKLVSEEPLAFAIEELGLDKYLLKGKGESKNKFDSKSMKADLFEAIVGAMCEDAGIEVSQKFVLSCLDSLFKSYNNVADFADHKTKLQEKLVGQKIIYNTTKVDKSGYFEYISKIKINGVLCGTGKGRNKKTAEQLAAKMALEKITKE